MTSTQVHKGERAYTPRSLKIYDAIVITVSNRLAWRCPSRVMLERYNRFLAPRHLEIGPGTGWYLAHADLPRDIEITLADLNASTMAATSTRIAGVPTRTVTADVLEPMPDGIGGFDSIGLNYVLHCLAGGAGAIRAALANLAAVLAPDGVLFGATILGDDVHHNLFGRGLMAIYNRTGIFSNRDDGLDDLRAGLQASFADVEIRMYGTVALFSATGPRLTRTV